MSVDNIEEKIKKEIREFKKKLNEITDEILKDDN